MYVLICVPDCFVVSLHGGRVSFIIATGFSPIFSRVEFLCCIIVDVPSQTF